MDAKRLIGERIRQLRKSRDLTQEQLAERIGRSVDAVSNLERGINTPNFNTLALLGEALDVPLREFFDFPAKGIGHGPKRKALERQLLADFRKLSDRDATAVAELAKSLRRK